MLETAKSDGKLKFASDSNISDNFYSFASLLLKTLKTGNSCHTNMSKLAKKNGGGGERLEEGVCPVGFCFGEGECVCGFVLKLQWISSHVQGPFISTCLPINSRRFSIFFFFFFL